jgi:hypothetical protein
MNASILSSRRSKMLAALTVAAALTLGACTPSTGGQSGSAGGKTPEPPKITLGEYFTHPTDLVVDGLTGQKRLFAVEGVVEGRRLVRG